MCVDDVAPLACLLQEKAQLSALSETNETQTER